MSDFASRYEDDYYDHERQAQESWGRGQYDNFEVRGGWQGRDDGPSGPPMQNQRGGGHMRGGPGPGPGYQGPGPQGGPGFPPGHPGNQQHVSTTTFII